MLGCNFHWEFKCLEGWLMSSEALTVREMFWFDIPNLISKTVVVFACIGVCHRLQLCFKSADTNTDPAQLLSSHSSSHWLKLCLCSYEPDQLLKPILLPSPGWLSRSVLNDVTCWGFVSFQTSYWWTPGASQASGRFQPNVRQLSGRRFRTQHQQHKHSRQSSLHWDSPTKNASETFIKNSQLLYKFPSPSGLLMMIMALLAKIRKTCRSLEHIYSRLVVQSVNKNIKPFKQYSAKNTQADSKKYKYSSIQKRLK